MTDIVTYIGGLAVKCLNCDNIYTTHSTYQPSGWCNWCQRHTKYESWIFLSGGDPRQYDITRRACAEPDPQSGWFSRLCSLPDGHDGDHVNGITGRSWPQWEPRDHVEAELIAALSAGDRGVREVYADWLDGRGEADHAAYVRPVPLGYRRSKLVLEPGWRSVVSRAIWNSAFGGPE